MGPWPEQFLFALSRDQVFDSPSQDPSRLQVSSFYSLFREIRSSTASTSTASSTSQTGFYSLFREIRSSTFVARGCRNAVPFLFALSRDQVFDTPVARSDRGGLVSIRSFARSGLRPRSVARSVARSVFLFALSRDQVFDKGELTQSGVPFPKFLFALSRDQVFDLGCLSPCHMGPQPVSIRSFARSGLRHDDTVADDADQGFYSLFREIRSSTASSPLSRWPPTVSIRSFARSGLRRCRCVP